MDLGIGGDDVAQKRFGALDVDGEIVVDEKDGDLAAFFFGAGFQQEQFIYDAFIGAEADGVAEESSDRTEFTAVRAAAAGLHRNDAKRAPAFADALQGALDHLGNQVELMEIDFAAGVWGIVLGAGLGPWAEVVARSVKIFERTARSVWDNLWRGFVGFAESGGVGRARPAVAAECFIE